MLTSWIKGTGLRGMSNADSSYSEENIYMTDQSLPETPTGVLMGREVTVLKKSKPSSLNFPPGADKAKSTTIVEESQHIKRTLEETSCAFARCVSLHNEIKVDSRLLSNVASEKQDIDKEYLPEKPLIKASDSFSSALELSINELNNEDACHTTVSVLEKNFSKEEYSRPYIFFPYDQQIYKTYINSDPEHNYIFIHKIYYLLPNVKVYSHDFVILRKNNLFEILQSMVGAFSLDQWLTGDPSTIIANKKNYQRANDLNLFSRDNESPPFFTKEKKDKIKRLGEELKKTEQPFYKAIKTRKNKPCSKAVFNQKILPTLFSALSNSDDHPYFRMFAVSRRYLNIRPEYQLLLEVYNAQI
ncbi:hypothetical protein [Endozoicomonas sp. ALB091]|uniref:hypothetical protein n=1 Tax=Endozoicomonas sp. ALB091 TaxID=3403073 RepID=UPI003BB7F311